MIENNLEHFEIIDGEINLDKLESGEEIILVAYNEVIFRVTWDTKHNRVYSYGVRDSEIPYEKNNIKNTEEFSSVSAKLNYKAGDIINLRTVYSDALEYTWENDNHMRDGYLELDTEALSLMSLTEEDVTQLGYLEKLQKLGKNIPTVPH